MDNTIYNFTVRTWDVVYLRRVAVARHVGVGKGDHDGPVPPNLSSRIALALTRGDFAPVSRRVPQKGRAVAAAWGALSRRLQSPKGARRA
eukprot:6176479-Pleurochrysis_carterae.AAC.1